MRRLGIRIWGHMIRELKESRELTMRLVYRDFSARYRQSFLGYLWAIIPPLVTVALFTFLTSHRVLPIGNTPLPYPVFAIFSLSIWQLFAGIVGACTGSVAGAGALVTKVNFPKEVLVFSAIGQPLIDFIIRFVPIAILFYVYGVVPSWQILFIPLMLVPILLLAIGCGFFFAVANLAIKDVGSIVGIALTLGVFAAPILYPPPVTAPYYLVNVFNPFSPLLIAVQEAVVGSGFSNIDLYFATCLFSLMIFLSGWRLFHLVIPRIIQIV